MKLIVTFCFVILATTTFAANIMSPKAAVLVSNEISVDEISGKELYQNNCAKCHGADGTGGKGPNLTTEKKQAKWKDSDEKLVAKITNGAWGMPAFGDKLKPAEIKAIADHVRTFKPAATTAK